MLNSLLPIYYNLAGKYTESERQFKKYLKRELKFYQKLSQEAIRNGWYEINIKRKFSENQQNFEDPSAY